MLNHPSDNQKLDLNISIFTAFKVTSVVLLLILSLKFIDSIFAVILLLLLSLFLAIALNPVVGRISRSLRIKKRGLATGIAFALIVSILAGLLAVTIPTVITQVTEFASNSKGIIEDLEQDSFFSDLITGFQVDTYITDFADSISERFGDNIDNIVDVLRSIGSALLGLIIVLVMTFLMLIEGPSFVEQIKKLLPKDRSRKWQRLGKQMSEVISGYITGQILIAIIAGLFAMLFMIIVDSDSGFGDALAKATIVSFFALIPLIGALVGAAIVVFLTFLVDPNLALVLAVYFIAYQQIENVTIQPWIQGQQTNLSTLQVVIAALVGAQAAGIVGALLAVPIAACLKIVIIDYLRTHKYDIDKKYKSLSSSKKEGLS